MADRLETMGVVVAAALGAAITAVLVVGPHDEQFRTVLILAYFVGLAGALWAVFGAMKMLWPPSAAALARAKAGQRSGAEPNREARPHGSARFPAALDASPMEVRMVGSLKSIRDQAEQGLFATDAEKAQHLRAIWSMAACDLDDDPDQIAH